jgi:hypothetical protein
MLRHVDHMPFCGIGVPALAMRNIWRGSTARYRGLGARALRIQARWRQLTEGLPRRARGGSGGQKATRTVLGGGTAWAKSRKLPLSWSWRLAVAFGRANTVIVQSSG